MTDHQLKDAITRALAKADHIDDAAIGVAVHHGVVTLSGVTHEWTKKHQIETFVRNIEGVRDVANDIVLEYRGCAQPCDSTLIEELRSAFGPALAKDIRIVADDHSITLTGTVASAADRERAIATACACAGVLDVDAAELAIR